MKRIISFICAFVLLSIPSMAFASVLRDETIYVNLNHDGARREIEIINRLTSDGKESGEFFVDYGKYDEITPLVDVKGKINKDQIQWPLSFLNQEDIYYRGTLKKDLPLSVNIRYFLDEKEMNPKDLAGKDGKVKIEITLSKSKLTHQVTVPLNLEHFRHVKTDGLTSVVGKTMQVVFVHLPGQKGVYTLEADALDFTLEPIQIVGSYQNINLGADFNEQIQNLKAGLRTIYDKMGELSYGANRLSQGSSGLVGGLAQLEGGLSQANGGFASYLASMDKLGQGSVEFSHGVGLIYQQMEDLSGLMDSLSNLGRLVEEMEKLSQASQELLQAYKSLDHGQEELSQGLVRLNQGHQAILSQITPLAQEEGLAPLVQALEEEGTAIYQLTQASQNLRVYEKKSLEGLEKLSTGLEKMLESIRPLMDNPGQKLPSKEEAGKVKMLAQSAKALQEGLLAFSQGGDKLFSGYVALEGGFHELSQGLVKLQSGSQQLSGGIRGLQEQGLAPVLLGIEEAVKPLEEKSLPTSFVDERNKIASITFIMQTPRIKPQEEATKDAPLPSEKNLLERILDLFR